MPEEIFLGFIVIAFTASASFFIRKRSLLWFHLVALMLYFPFMPVLKYALNYRGFKENDSIYIDTYFAIVLYAVGYVLVACTRLANKSIINRQWIALISTQRIRRIAFYSYIFVWIIRLIKGIGFGIIYSGSASEDVVASLPYWLSVAGSIAEILAGGVFIVYAIHAAKFKNLSFLLIPFIEIVWIFISVGRREFLLACGVLVLIARYILKVRIHTLCLTSLACIVFLWFASPYFLTVRDINSTMLSRGADPVNALTQSFTIASEICRASLDCGRPISENIINRSNVFEFQKSIVTELDSGKEYLWGDGLFTAMRWAIPSVIIAKPTYMTEQFIQNKLSMPLRDDAISIIALSYADLGFIGVFLAGAVCAVYFGFMFIILRRFANPFIGASILFCVLSLMWNVEVDPTAFFAKARDITLILLICWMWAKFRASPRRMFKRQFYQDEDSFH